MLGNQNSISTKEPQFASIAAANCIAVNTQGGVPHLNAHIISPYGITAVPPMVQGQLFCLWAVPRCVWVLHNSSNQHYNREKLCFAHQEEPL